jgi:hypothetical protein
VNRLIHRLLLGVLDGLVLLPALALMIRDGFNDN